MKTIAEVNKKAISGKAVVVDAEEAVKIVKNEGAPEVVRATGERPALPQGYMFSI